MNLTLGNPILRTNDNITFLFLRLVMGIVIIPHGAQKLLGWFGGYGLDGTMGYFASLGVPALFGWLAITAEVVGGLALMAGFLSRIAAFGVAATLVTAVMLQHASVGFFMNWGGTLQGEGFEYHILAVAICTAIMIGGSGPYSVDRLLARRGR